MMTFLTIVFFVLFVSFVVLWIHAEIGDES